MKQWILLGLDSTRIQMRTHGRAQSHVPHPVSFTNFALFILLDKQTEYILSAACGSESARRCECLTAGANRYGKQLNTFVLLLLLFFLFTFFLFLFILHWFRLSCVWVRRQLIFIVTSYCTESRLGCKHFMVQKYINISENMGMRKVWRDAFQIENDSVVYSWQRKYYAECFHCYFLGFSI